MSALYPRQRHISVAMALSLLMVSTACARRIPATERAPASLAGQLELVMDKAVRNGAFPGGIAIVGNREGIVASYGAGQLDQDDSTRPSLTTIWDLASLTKVVVTTTAVMQLVQDGRIALDSPVVNYLPQWTAPGSAQVTVRQLLTHSSGLRAGRPLYRESDSADSARRLVLTTGPDSTPGTRYTYSDLGFMLLGMTVEKISGQKIDEYAAANIFSPLGMLESQYLPSTELLSRIAPTELDPWRGRKVRGEVHDENTVRLGGVSGHAGVFSTGSDIARFAQAMLLFGELGGARIVDSLMVRDFTKLQDSTLSHRALGWEKPNGTNSAGHGLSRQAFGHTGYTGTSLWIDPGQGLFIVLLTNRVNPSRENLKISGVRTELADSVTSTSRQYESRLFLEGEKKRR